MDKTAWSRFVGSLNQAVELTRAGLIDPSFVGEPQDPNRLQNPQGTQCITIGGVLRTLKTHRHMALGTKVVNLIGLHLLDDPNQVGAVRDRRSGELAGDRSREGLDRDDRSGSC